MVSPGGEWCHIFYLVHFIFFNILSGVSPGCRTGVSIKSGPNSIFSAAVNVTASDLVEVRICQTFLWLIQFFNSWAAGGCRQGKSTSSKWTSSFEFVLSAAERTTFGRENQFHDQTFPLVTRQPRRWPRWTWETGSIIGTYHFHLSTWLGTTLWLYSL